MLILEMWYLESPNLKAGFILKPTDEAPKCTKHECKMEFLIGRVKRDLEMEEFKRKKLRELDLIVMDNSIRESTVGQLRGHTLENKWKIYDEIEQCGFQYRIVAAFSHMTRVDDTFIKELIDEAGNDRENFFAFTEAFENVNVRWKVVKDCFKAVNVRLSDVKCQSDVETRV